MTVAEAAAPTGSSRREPNLLTAAAWASIAAGAVHAAAIGVHAEHRQAALAFTAVAVFQVLWGVVAIAWPNRAVAGIGAAGGVALVGAWVLAKTSGIPFVEGLGAAEPAQLADTAAAVLAAGSAGLALSIAMADGRRRHWQPLGRLASGATVVAVLGLTVPAMVSASSHSHAGGHGDDAAHAHGTEQPASPSGSGVAATDDGHDHGDAAPVPPTPYHPDEPIDLSGVEGVTPQQQAAAENLIAITLDRLPRYADPAVAEADGFRSIRDGGTGHEHYINWRYIDDEHILNPDYPESLVYEPRPDGSKELVSAMFMLRSGTTLDDVPELGGPLTQWHVHDNLCFTDDPEAPRVGGLTNPDGSCNPPLVTGTQVPMIHVWIVPHPCGPFAGLDGVAGGTVPEGEERLCDHAHGA